MEIIRRRLLIIAVIGQLIIVAAESDVKRPKTIAELQAEYLISEEKLWHKIDQLLSDAEHIDEQRLNETMLEAVNVHQNVFFENTFESSSYWRSYLLFGIDNFRGYLSNVNTSLLEHYRYLYDEDGQVRFKRWNVCIDPGSFHNLTANRNGLFDLTINRKDSILQHIQTEAKCCIRYVNYVISEAQLVREYYANVGKAVLRSYAMHQLAHMLMSLIVRENSHATANAERKLYLERYNEFKHTIEGMLTASSLDLWKCNPNPYLDSRTYYTSVTNFMQGYIDNEINLNGEQRCDGTCSDFKLTKNHYDCQNGTLCAHSNFAHARCTGDIFDCSVIDSDGTACLVKDEWENRRYNYVTFRNGSTNGHNVLCFKAEQTELATRSERISNECSNCFCYCDEPGQKSDRYFSLKDVTSDIGANKIVTGIAIKKINRVIQLTISERELFAFGKVNDTLKRTQIWKNNSMEFLSDGQNDVDYFTLTREHRSINLDTIFLPLNKVVTGIRFKAQDNMLIIEIRATDFDYETGMLTNLEHSTWIKHTDNRINEHREEITIFEPDSPTRTTNIQERFDSNNKFIRFRSTDIKKDLSQLTIPFFESVPLEASEPRPLSGVGLYYKGENGFGGYIAVKLISYDRGTI
ncbi:uncharacterized protein LOC129579086 [Sitodiplosis mosellana]|uniref:uncharacterized protein LOC129579086 n=1 Tax=Sitodiplosis mosellana TaxID=263140 RepID=UPI00244517C3|nr:uncharacterized protein LOC129579086 [Sitodiplosis mosellana]